MLTHLFITTTLFGLCLTETMLRARSPYKVKKLFGNDGEI